MFVSTPVWHREDARNQRACDRKVVTTLCPGGKERMRRLMELVRHGHTPAFLVKSAQTIEKK